jgi:hypothetical protein
MLAAALVGAALLELDTGRAAQDKTSGHPDSSWTEANAPLAK